MSTEFGWEAIFHLQPQVRPAAQSVALAFLKCSLSEGQWAIVSLGWTRVWIAMGCLAARLLGAGAWCQPGLCVTSPSSCQPRDYCSHTMITLLDSHTNSSFMLSCCFLPQETKRLFDTMIAEGISSDCKKKSEKKERTFSSIVVFEQWFGKLLPLRCQ